MKRFYQFLLCMPFLFPFGNAKASNSDSINVLHYNIHIDTLDMLVDTLAAHTEVVVMPRISNLNLFSLDLLKLNVDSVSVNGVNSTFSYNDTLLVIHSPVAYNPADTVRLMVWYNGVPQMDGSGWGGFYLNNALYAYNLGVGFDADPHTYGRVWFPCKDNFTDKATYDFWVETIPGRIAVCNGTLQGQSTGSDGNVTWHWRLHDPICTYMASVAVSDYVAVTDEFISLTGDTIPISIYVRPSDTADAVGSFQNLQAAMTGFESKFGPYRFERIGFVAVPFNSGAMEHATNIAYPASTINGGTQYEYLWGHELSHMWFGDLVTCETAEDMWLNEGFASWCEAIFMETVYSYATYKNYVRSNHSEVLRKAHVDDGGYRAVSGVPHAYTYGTTVYDKGASVAHALRHYIGNTIFFTGIQNYLDQYAWANASSDTLKNSLAASSGMNLDDFFATWVYQPGFTHFSIDSFSVSGTGPYNVTVHMRQRLKGTSVLYNSNRIWITFMDANRVQNTQLMTFSGATGTQSFTVPFSPVSVMADIEEYITDATIDNYLNISAPATIAYPNTYFTAEVQAVTDTAFLRITHNWVGPDSFATAHPGMNLCPLRYWTVEGNFPSGFHTRGRFNYNGSASALLDASWMINSEDSMLIFWRPGAGHDWQLVNSFTRNIGGSPTDRIGSITVDTLVAGEYALGIYENFMSTQHPAHPVAFTFFPNPGENEVMFSFPDAEGYTLRITDLSGKIVASHRIPEGQNQCNVDVSEWAQGFYLVSVKGKKGKSGAARLVVE